MKAYQKGICLAVATVMMAGCLAGCGDSRSGGGVSNPEKAAKMWEKAIYNLDVETTMSLIPTDVKDWLVNEYSTTENQIRDLLETYLKEEMDGCEIKDVNISKVEEFSADEMQDFNEKLQYATGNLSEEGYTVTCNVEVEYEGEMREIEKESYVYEYDGNYYVQNASSTIAHILK